MPETQLFYHNAQITVSSTLFGIRYLMRHWFLTVASIAIAFMSISMFLFFAISYLIVRQAMKATLLRLYPNLKYYSEQSDGEENSDEDTSGDEKEPPRELDSSERIVLLILKALMW